MFEGFSIVLGGVISGCIGILTTYLQGMVSEHRWRKETIYKPLYNEITWIVDTQAKGISEGFNSFWKDADPFLKLRTDGKLRENLSNYLEIIEGLKTLQERRNELLKNNIDIISKAVKKAFPSEMIENDSIVLKRYNSGKQSIEIQKWIEMFYEALLLGKRGEELRKALISYSGKTGHDKHFKEWDSDIFYNLGEKLNQVDIEGLAKADKDIEMRRKELVNQCELLQELLVKKINKMW